MLPFSLYDKKRLAIGYMKRPLFPTTLTIPYYDIVKQFGIRAYQPPLVFNVSCRLQNIYREVLSGNLKFLHVKTDGVENTSVIVPHTVVGNGYAPLC
jgi:hypothetical protein